jgi:phosphate transport system protein
MTVLDHVLIGIRDDIIRLSSLVDQAVSRAVRALKELDVDLAHEVVNDDSQLDNLHRKIENNVASAFAMHSPMARDMRLLVANLLISNELERMGDHAEGIAKTVLRYSGDSTISLPYQVPKMTETVHNMIVQVMDAYIGLDTNKARELASLDTELDDLYRSLFNDTVSAMSKGSLSVEKGTYLLWVGHNLERVGDRVTNICERIVYATTGVPEDFNPTATEL